MIGSTDIDLSDYYTKNETNTLLSAKENTSNKVTFLSDESTDEEYPSAMCVYDALEEKVDNDKMPLIASCRIDKSTVSDTTVLLTISNTDTTFYEMASAYENGQEVIIKASYVMGNFSHDFYVPLVDAFASRGDVSRLSFVVKVDSDFIDEWHVAFSGYDSFISIDVTNEFWLGYLTCKETAMENTANKVTSLSAQSTDTQYPSAKCVYDGLDTKANTATTLSGYGIANAYTKTEVDNLISAISTLSFEVVQTKPTTNIKTNVIYLVPKSSSETDNIYEEWIYVNNAWELIGTTSIDLSNYYTKTQVDNLIPTVPTKTSDLTNDSGYLTTSSTAIANKELLSNKVTSLSSSSTDAQYPSAKCVYDVSPFVSILEYNSQLNGLASREGYTFRDIFKNCYIWDGMNCYPKKPLFLGNTDYGCPLHINMFIYDEDYTEFKIEAYSIDLQTGEIIYYEGNTTNPNSIFVLKELKTHEIYNN